MTPGNLGPKTIKLWKSSKSWKSQFVFQHGKDAHRSFEKGALNDSSRSLKWSFLEQIVFLEICEKVVKILKSAQFWVQAVCLTTRLRRVIGCLQTPGASRRRALRGFSSAKKPSTNQIITVAGRKLIAVSRRKITAVARRKIIAVARRKNNCSI